MYWLSKVQKPIYGCWTLLNLKKKTFLQTNKQVYIMMSPLGNSNKFIYTTDFYAGIMCRKVFAENSILPQIFRIQHIGIFNKFKFGITLEFAPNKGALICTQKNFQSG